MQATSHTAALPPPVRRFTGANPARRCRAGAAQLPRHWRVPAANLPPDRRESRAFGETPPKRLNFTNGRMTGLAYPEPRT